MTAVCLCALIVSVLLTACCSGCVRITAGDASVRDADVYANYPDITETPENKVAKTIPPYYIADTSNVSSLN